MKNPKLLYILVFGVTAILFVLFEYGILPLDLIPYTNENKYIIDLVSIVTAIGGCFLLLYSFRFSIVRFCMMTQGEPFIIKVNCWRLWIWLLLMLVNIVLYYEATFATNPKYGILILFIAGIFCWPSTGNPDIKVGSNNS